MKQQSLNAFFASSAAAKAGRKASEGSGDAAAKENAKRQDAPPAAEAVDKSRLKRLKRNDDEATPAAKQLAAEAQLEDAMDEQPSSSRQAALGPSGTPADPPPGSSTPAAKAAPGASASPLKMSPAEASKAFSKLMGDGGGGGKAQQPAAKKQKAAASGAKAGKQAAGKAAKPAAAGAAAGAAHEELEAVRRAAAAEGALGKGKDPSPAAPALTAAAPAALDQLEAGEPGSEEEEIEEDSGEGEEAGGADVLSLLGSGQAGGPSKPKAKKAKKSGAAGKATGLVDGVGLGALEAAKAYGAAKVDEQAADWPAGKSVPFAALATAFEDIANTTKRLEIIKTLVGFFRALLAHSPADLLPAVYLCTSRVAPAHEGLELGIGEATLIKALAQTTGRKESAIKKEAEEAGDLGVVANACRSTQRTMFPPPPLTIQGVFKTLREIAGTTGKEAMDRKRALIAKLLVASKGLESGFIMRLLQGKMRIGLQEQSVLVALAHAAHLHRNGVGDKGPKLADALETAACIIKQAYSECPSYDVLIPALLEMPVAELGERVHFMPGVPVRPMLAKPTTGVGEVLDKFAGQEFTCEYKYDGERAQIHVLEGCGVHIYSRNAEDNTPKYPDIVGRVPGWLAEGTRSIVIDAEAVAWDPAERKILPFQVLSTRGRKDVALGSIKVQVLVFAFDCLYLNGDTLLHRPLTERRAALYGALKEVPDQLEFATAKTSKDIEELAAFLDEAVAASTEGLIVKTMADAYDPARRSSHWLKLKKDYLEGVGDTFDCVPIGAFYGRGKRTGVFGAYLLAVYDEEGETFQTIAKVGTGFSEEQLKELADVLRPAIITAPKSYYRYGDGQAPDVWFEPAAVWEIKAADLSISPVHQAAQGLVDDTKGISIRFPRLVRVRDDKKPEEATSAAQVADMYRQQAVVAAKGKAAAVDDDE